MAGSGGMAELAGSEMPDPPVDGAAAVALECPMDLKDSAAGDYREGEMLASGGINDKEPCKKDEEEMITSEQFGMELCAHPHEQNIVASEKKCTEDHSLASRDELPSTGVEKNEYEDHSLAHSIELPNVVIETEDDEDDSPVHRNELPSVTIDSKYGEDNSQINRNELPSVTIGSKDDEDQPPVHRDELPSVTIGSKDDEDHYLVHIDDLPYLVHRDELSAVNIDNKDDDDHSLSHTDELPSVTIHTDELPSVTIGSKDNEDNSPVHRDELSTDVLENKDHLRGLKATDVNNFTVHSSQITSHNEEEQLTDVISSTHRQSPSPPNNSIYEEQPISRIEDKYVVAAQHGEEALTVTDQQGDLHTIVDGNTDTSYGGDDSQFAEQQIVKDSGLLLTDSAVLDASFSSQDGCADVDDVDIGIDTSVDEAQPCTDAYDLLGRTSNDDTTVDTLDVQCSLIEAVTVSNVLLECGASGVDDTPVEVKTKPCYDEFPTDNGGATGPLKHATDGESDAPWVDTSDAPCVDPMVAIDEESENIVVTSISDTKHDSDDDEFGFEVAQEKDICLSRNGSGEHASTAEITELHKPQEAEDVLVAVITDDLEPQHGSSLTEQDEREKNEALREAEDEWANVEEITAGFGASGDYVVEKRATTVVVSYHDTLEAVRRSDVTQYQPHIRTSVRRRGLAALKYIFCGPPRLNEDLVIDRNLAFCMATCPFSNDNVLHLQVLQTIYKKLTGSSFDCPRYGNHWEQIGFQGIDPATDLRGVGFLALLHLLYAVTTPKFARLIRDIYRLSLDEIQNFPLCIMSINMTRIAVQALREDCLNKWCNHGNQVMPVLSEFYLGAFMRMYDVWKHETKTIRDSGNVLHDLERFAKKNPALILRNLEVYAHTPRNEARESLSPPRPPPPVTVSPLCPGHADEFVSERYPSPDEHDEAKFDEDTANKEFFSVCDNNDANLGNLI